MKTTFNVLLIDDDPEDAHVAEIALRLDHESKYRVRSVTTLRAAAEAMEEAEFDVAVLDLGLPGLHGIEALERFRIINDTIPVVVLSGLEDEEIAIRTLEYHAQDYLSKASMNTRCLSRAIRYSIQRQHGLCQVQSLLEETREKEEELNRKNRRLEEMYNTAHKFVDNVSHEFRTPLTVIKEYISLVQDGTLGEVNEEQKQFLRIAEDRANDLNTMVDDMLDVSRLGAGLMNAFRESHEVTSIIHEVYDPLSRKAEVKELQLQVEVEDNLPAVYCDSEKVARVLINLAINAMKFTQSGGIVKLTARRQAADVVFSVTDNGVGIPEEKISEIFDRFQQVDSRSYASTKGFGLGLSIAMELVDLNFGKLSVESKVGEGSTFSFTVPCLDFAEITNRFIQHLDDRHIDTLSVVSAVTPTAASAAEVDAFLRHAVRGSDIVFRVADGNWRILVPDSLLETKHCIERLRQELEHFNRNRPRGALPEIHFRREISWTQLNARREEILDFVRKSTQVGPSPYSNHRPDHETKQDPNH